MNDAANKGANMENTIEISDTRGTKTRKAIIIVNIDGSFDVEFGQVIGAEFVPSHYTQSRKYKTYTGAHKAAVRWVY